MVRSGGGCLPTVVISPGPGSPAGAFFRRERGRPRRADQRCDIGEMRARQEGVSRRGCDTTPVGCERQCRYSGGRSPLVPSMFPRFAAGHVRPAARRSCHPARVLHSVRPDLLAPSALPLPGHDVSPTGRAEGSTGRGDPHAGGRGVGPTVQPVPTQAGDGGAGARAGRPGLRAGGGTTVAGGAGRGRARRRAASWISVGRPGAFVTSAKCCVLATRRRLPLDLAARDAPSD
jgi:hypothetical protein